MFPSQLCKEHHGFGCLLKLFWLWHFVKHFVDLLVYMCLLAGWPLDFGLRVLVDDLYVCCSNKQEDTIMEHTSTICNMIDKPKHLKSDFIHE
jgi:hypothetical protein